MTDFGAAIANIRIQISLINSKTMALVGCDDYSNHFSHYVQNCFQSLWKLFCLFSLNSHRSCRSSSFEGIFYLGNGQMWWMSMIKLCSKFLANKKIYSTEIMRLIFRALLRWFWKQSLTFINVLNQCHPVELSRWWKWFLLVLSTTVGTKPCVASKHLKWGKYEWETYF